MEHWILRDKTQLLSTMPFAVERLLLENRTDGKTHEYFRLNCPDWVNIFPVTREGQALLIEQDRAGALSSVLEIPGGIIESNEKDTTMAALRELEEETGYISSRLLPLASINPNPAIMNNRVHYFLALDCTPATKRRHFADEQEKITVRTVRLSELDLMIRTGQINHSLCALGIMLAMQYLGNFGPRNEST